MFYDRISQITICLGASTSHDLLAKMATCFIAIYFLAVAFFPLAESCGCSTHIEISYRAQDHFHAFQSNTDYGQLLLKHQDALEAGSPYPDAYYPNVCAGGKYHDIAEDTHWTPFMNATINYIRKHYPAPLDQATEKLVVFFLGLVSHQVADINWHGLGIEQGFLDAMGDTNFHGSFPAAHSAGDVGGDIMSVFEFNLTHMPYINEWYVPVDDLFNIYVEMYGEVRLPRDVIVDCTAILFAERFGEKLAIDKLYPIYAEKSPFLVDQLTDYFLGGLDDMSVWTQYVWREAVHMLEKGTGVCKLDHNPIYIQCNWGQTQRPYKKRGRRPEKNGFYMEPRYYSLRQDIVVKNTLRGVTLSLSPRLQEALYLAEKEKQKSLMIKKEKQQQPATASNQRTPDAVYSVNNTYAKLGWSLAVADLDGDGNEDVVIGAPGYRVANTTQAGAVFVVYSTDKGLPLGELNLEQSADVVLDGMEDVNGRWGSSVAVLDVNLDGIMDIAVGAPSVGSGTLTYVGSVLVYYGLGRRSFEHNMSILCMDHYCTLGRTLATVDLNGDGFDDLLMGSPFSGRGGDQRGIVTALLSDEQYQGNFIVLLVDQLYWTATGSQNYSWFGDSLVTKALGDGTSLMFVSEPTWRKCVLPNCSFSSNDVQSVGQLNVFSSYKGKPLSLAKQLMGSAEFESFGASVAVGKPYSDGTLVLAVSATGKDVAGSVLDLGVNFTQTGAIFLYNLTDLQQPPLAILNGDRRFSRFGSKMLFADVNGDGHDDFIIGAPLRTDDFTEEIYAGEEGAAYIFYGGQSFPKGPDATSKCGDFSLVKPCPGQSASVELVFGENKARLGSAFAAVRSKKGVDLLVTALHSSLQARLSGAVALYSFQH